MSDQLNFGLPDYLSLEESNLSVVDTEDEINIETGDYSEEEIKTGQTSKNYESADFQIIGVDGGIWPIRKNYYGRVVEVKDDYISVDCLIDPLNKEFEERKFLKLMFENLKDLFIGKYVLIKIFVRQGKSQLIIDDAEKLVNKDLFENKSKYSDLADIDNPKITIDKL